MYKTQDKAAKTFFANIDQRETNNFKLTKFPYFSLLLDAILISRTINELISPWLMIFLSASAALCPKQLF